MSMGNVVYAFFDVDGTIINMNSMLSFLEYLFERHYGDKSSEMMCEYQSKISDDISREKLNELYYQNFTGIQKSTLVSYGLDWFHQIIGNEELFHKKCLTRLKWHQQMNHQIILVSGGFFATLNPLAEYLNLRNILCVQPSIINGELNGEINMQTQTIGVGKKNAILSFLQLQNINIDQALSRSYAYGDHISDSAMLAMVGNPVVVGNDIEMLNIAYNNKWHILK